MSIPVIKLLTIGILPSFLKVSYLRLKGAKIGKGVKIGLFSFVDGHEVVIEDNAKIGLMSFIQARTVQIGKRVEIGNLVAVQSGVFSIDNDSTIMDQVAIGGMMTPRSSLCIGKRVKIFPFCFINPTEPIVIEDDVGVGGSNYIFTHGTWPSMLEGFPGGFGPVTIKKGTWLPWRVFIMPNVTIGEFCIVGAGSVVNKSFPDRTLVAGMPAKAVSSDGAYIKKMSYEDKVSLLKKIVDDKVEYERYNGLIVEVVQLNDSVILSAKRGADASRTLLFFGDPLATLPETKIDALVSLNSLPKSKRVELNNAGIDWFDLEEKCTRFSESGSWADWRAFLSRYGIRFEVLERT